MLRLSGFRRPILPSPTFAAARLVSRSPFADTSSHSTTIQSRCTLTPAALFAPTSVSSPPFVRTLKEFHGKNLGMNPRDRKKKGVVAIPQFVTADHLAYLLKQPLKQFSRDASRIFSDWWPVLSSRSQKKEAFSSVKEVLLSFEESCAIAKFYRREPILHDVALENDTWASSEPFGKYEAKSGPAVVSILGHKDHGKTTLLDKLRGGNMAQKEEFGITQETYAFQVRIHPPPPVSGSKKSLSPQSSSLFSFLDTPGHVSYSDMRSTVAGMSDLIMLVVAADEGVLDQSFETLRMARNLNVPLMVVINKIDLPGSQERVEQIKNVLKELGAKLHTAAKPKSSLEGDITVVELSAKYDETNLRELREVLLTLTNKPHHDRSYNANEVPKGIVVESFVQRGIGNVVRVNLTHGVLKKGQAFICEGVFEGKVKDMKLMKAGSIGDRESPDQTKYDDQSNSSVDAAGVGMTVDIAGCVALPSPGSQFEVVQSHEAAKSMALVKRSEVRYHEQQRAIQQQQENPSSDAFNPLGLDSTRSQIQEDGAEFDEVEEVDEVALDDEAVGAEHDEDADAEDHDDDGGGGEMIAADDVPVDLDPRSRIAPPLPPRSQWELSPAPPPKQRSLPIANLKPTFRFYQLQDDTPTTTISSNIDGEFSPVSSAVGDQPQRFGLIVSLKTSQSGALLMLRQAIDDMNVRNAEKGLPAVHIAQQSVGEVTKRDLITAEAEGCWVYGFRIVRPNKATVQQARSRRVPLFTFRHHQHLLDSLQHHIEQSPRLTETGEVALDDEEQAKALTTDKNQN